MAKIVKTFRNGFELHWSNNPKNSREVNCNVSHREIMVLEWTFPKLVGVAIGGNAGVLTSQAVIYAKEAIIKDYCYGKIKGEIQFRHPERGNGVMSSPPVMRLNDDHIVFANVENLLKSGWEFVKYEPNPS